MSKFQTGFFMNWAEIKEILGRSENFQTGTPVFVRLYGQQVHEYGDGLCKTLKIIGLLGVWKKLRKQIAK